MSHSNLSQGKNTGDNNILRNVLRIWAEILPEDRHMALAAIQARALIETVDRSREVRRSWILTNWLIRVLTASWLSAAQMNEAADRLKRAMPITNWGTLLLTQETIKNAHQELYRIAQQPSNDVARWAAHEAATTALRATGSDITPIVGDPDSSERLSVMAMFVNDVAPTHLWSAWIIAYRPAHASIQELIPQYEGALSFPNSDEGARIALQQAKERALETAQGALQPIVEEVQTKVPALLESMAYA